MTPFRPSEQTGLSDAVAPSDPIGLEGLVAAAGLQTRSSRKYVVTSDVVSAMVADLPGSSSALEIGGERVFGYETRYFDSPELDLYHQTARRRPFRYKVRTRRYSNDPDRAMLEVKTKNGRGVTVKHRIARRATERHALDGADRRWIAGHVDSDVIASLKPTMTTHFSRATVVTADGTARYTFDDGLHCVDATDGRTASMDGIIVECKSPLGPSAGDYWLWREGFRPLALSKYCTGMAALHRDLPANHWHRTLRTHFAPVRPDRRSQAGP